MCMCFKWVRKLSVLCLFSISVTHLAQELTVQVLVAIAAGYNTPCTPLLQVVDCNTKHDDLTQYYKGCNPVS